MKKALALVLALVMCLGVLVACGKKDDTTTNNNNENNNENTIPTPTEVLNFVNKVYGEDYITLYEKYGDEVKINDVIEDPDTGLAYIEKEGKKFELGLDFLSMAMVYNLEFTATETFKTVDDVYAGWWKLYIQRWNYLLPEVPLYCNEYYDLYNTAITGVKENPTNPYWSPSNALIDWSSTKADKSIIIGNSTDLSGKFRYSSFGATSPGAADNDVAGLTQGLETVVANKKGNYQWNDTVVKSHNEVINADGSKTFTIEIYDDLKFSDGSAVKASNYLVTALVFSTPVAAQAAGRDHKAGLYFVGYDSFAAYKGEAAEGATKEFSGLRVLGDYKFSVTVAADYIPYYYDIAYASFAPSYTNMWTNGAQVKDDGNGAYLTSDFYAKSGTDYTVAAHILASSKNTDTTYPYSGPYVVKSYDQATKEAVLEKNTYFKGNYEGTKPAIEKVIYKKIVSSTQMADFKAGGVDIIAGITGGAETDEAIKYADEQSGGKAAYVHYSRAGYGKLGFRCDFGPAQFVEVRQAIAYCMDRADFAKQFTGGYGGVVHGPYYEGSWMYEAAKKQGLNLDVYATSADSAIEILEEGGWLFDKDGNAYVSGVRYKAIPKDKISEADKTYQSKDGAYKTTLVGDYYYMPLVINWYGTSDNPFTDLLVTDFMENDNIEKIGMVVQNTIGDFAPMLDELYQQQVYGFYSGTPLYSAFNFATGFNSAVYDYSYYMTIDPAMYDDYSQYYIKDYADAYWLK